MEVGTVVVTLVGKPAYDEIEETETVIPEGTIGLVCEVYDGYAFVEIWGDGIPEGVWGVYDYNFNEIEERRSLPEKKDNRRS